MRSRLAGFALGFFLALVIAPAAGEARDGTVVVSAPGLGSETVTVNLNQLGAPDTVNREYALASGRRPITGYSLATVLESAESRSGGWLDLRRLQTFKVDRPQEGPVELSRSQALDRNFFRDGPPVFFEKDGTTVFIMPGSPGSEHTFRFAPVAIRASDSKALQIDLSSSPKRPRKSQRVAIRAAVSGAPDGSLLSFRWSFSDGVVKETTRPSVSHRFSGKGRRSVVVSVTGEGLGGQAALAIDVAGGPARDGGIQPTGPSGKPAADSPGYGLAAPGPGSGYGGIGGEGGAPARVSPRFDERPKQSDLRIDDELEEVTGVVIDPAASASAAAPESGNPEDESGGFGDGALGLSGEAATLFGVGLLIALGGLIEARVLVRRP